MLVATILDPRFKNAAFNEDTSVLARYHLISEIASAMPTVEQSLLSEPVVTKKPRLETSSMLLSMMMNKKQKISATVDAQHEIATVSVSNYFTLKLVLFRK